MRAAPWRYADAVKDPAIEEWIDYNWHRRIAFQLIRPLQYLDLPITPTQITIASLLLGLAGSASYWYAGEHGTRFYGIGTALVLTSVVFDCADGQLARLKKISSQIGEVLDGAVDFIVGAAMWIALSHATFVHMTEWWAWPSSVVLFVGIMVHAAYYDHVKNVFVRLGLPKDKRPPPKKLEATGVLGRFAVFMYETWFVGVSRAVCGPDLDQLDHVEPDVARAELYPTMRATSWLGIGIHFFIMYVAALVVMIIPGATFIIAHAVITVGLNAWMVRTVIMQRRAAKKLRNLAP